MTTMTENILNSMLLDTATLRTVEPYIYSVLPNDETGSEYDSDFGSFYDLVACNPLYNRIIWGYSVKLFHRIAKESLESSDGPFLDLACGSLAFTAKVYRHYMERPIVLADQSLKMLRMAKAKLTKARGNIAANIVLLHADAHAHALPFKENTFSTILSENLLHCLPDTAALLRQLKTILSETGAMAFTTLVRADRLADKYLESLADSGYLITRSESDHRNFFEQVGLSAEYRSQGNILIIHGKK